MVIQCTLFVTNSLLLHCDRTPTIRDKFSAATLWSNTHYSWQIQCCYIVIQHPLFVTNSVLLHCDRTSTIRDKFSAATLWSIIHYSWQIQCYYIVIEHPLFVRNSVQLHCDPTPNIHEKSSTPIIRDKFSIALWFNNHTSWQIQYYYIVIQYPLFVTNVVLLHCDTSEKIHCSVFH